MTDLFPVRRALISVSDKTGLVELAHVLAAGGIELLSTGGSAKTLRDAGLEVRDVAEVTGFPEMMDGRVKTLHPNVHGGLLALRDNADHVAAMQAHGIGGIDLLIVNLYPFEETLKNTSNHSEIIEKIDIGGVSLLRAASKNYEDVVVVSAKSQYEILAEILESQSGKTSHNQRQGYAQEAFSITSSYDTAIASYFKKINR